MAKRARKQKEESIEVKEVLNIEDEKLEIIEPTKPKKQEVKEAVQPTKYKPDLYKRLTEIKNEIHQYHNEVVDSKDEYRGAKKRQLHAIKEAIQSYVNRFTER